MRRKRTIHKKIVGKCGAEGLKIKVLSIRDKILGAEGSMSEVGIPPPHNLDKPNTLVDRNYRTTKVIFMEVVILILNL